MTLIKPTTKQLDLFFWIVSQTLRHLGQPSLREAMEHFGWGSTNAVADFLRRLEKHGLVTRSLGYPRALRITKRGWRLYKEACPSWKDEVGAGL